MRAIKITTITAAMLMFHIMIYAQERGGDTWSNDYNYQRGTEQDEQTRQDIEGEAGQTPADTATGVTETDVTEEADTVHEGIQEEMENVTDTVGQEQYDNRYERDKAADKLGKKVEKRTRKLDKALREDEKKDSGEGSATE